MLTIAMGSTSMNTSARILDSHQELILAREAQNLEAMATASPKKGVWLSTASSGKIECAALGALRLAGGPARRYIYGPPFNPSTPYEGANQVGLRLGAKRQRTGRELQLLVQVFTGKLTAYTVFVVGG
eukprot:GHVT01037499.1.p1 GENE.GHVT01037499.1~~GHVT01037499.1.p1  ORF type:complete len:128 (-),score=15.47 GHVT01037499.1:150-533(-)